MAFVFLRRRHSLAALTPMVLLPLATLLVPLLSQPGATLHQLLHQSVYADEGFITPTWHLDPGVGAFIRLSVALLAVPAAVLVARHLPRDRAAAADRVVWTLALLFGLRVFEPELVPSSWRRHSRSSPSAPHGGPGGAWPALRPSPCG